MGQKILGMGKKSNIFVTFRKKNFGYGKKNQTFLLLIEKKILGMEKKIKHFCYFWKKNFGYGK